MLEERTSPESTSLLKGHVAVVTGASRGIGRQIALSFAAAGASVAVNYRQNRTLAKQVATQCEQLGSSAVAIEADAADEASVKRLFVEATQLGTPSILVNNAGISDYGMLMDLSLETWHRVINTNLTSAFLCCREAIPYLRQVPHGRIINISSIHGISGSACEAAYAASKGGLLALTKSLAKELGSLQITVNAIAPGVVATDMMDEFSDEDKQNLAAQTPLLRLGTPTDIAPLACFLASSQANFITGQVISPNGGLMT